MGLAAVANHRIGGLIPVGALLSASIAIGRMRARLGSRFIAEPPMMVNSSGPGDPLRIL
jgi:hypothetical protein